MLRFPSPVLGTLLASIILTVYFYFNMLLMVTTADKVWFLTTMPVFSAVQDDEERMKTYVLNPVPSILKKELDETRKRIEQAEEFASSVTEALHEEVSFGCILWLK